MLKKIVWTTGPVALALVFAAAAWGQSTTNGAKATHSSASMTTADTTFAREAARGGMAEVKLGQLAEDKGSSQSVKDFGKRMVDDHSKANDQLKSVASSENMTLPDTLSAKDQATYDRLSRLSGTAFDKAYMRDMVSDHKTDIAAFEREAKDGRNTGIKDFASQTLPTLRDHLKQAEETVQAVNGTSSKTSGTGR